MDIALVESTMLRKPTWDDCATNNLPTIVGQQEVVDTEFLKAMTDYLYCLLVV